MRNFFDENQSFGFRTMRELKVAFRTYEPRIGTYSSDRLELVKLVEHMGLELRTAMLADWLGEERIIETRRENHECLRFATWWDHFKATYRGRWWMRWRRWAVAYNIENHPLTARAEIDMTRYWAFPQADIYVSELGDPVRFVESRRLRQDYESEAVTWTARQEPTTKEGKQRWN